MTSDQQPSRLNPRYLAARHAGWVFLFAALGLCAGTAWRCFCQPTRYEAATETAVRVVPAASAASFDWEAARREWRAVPGNDRDVRLLGANLRHLLKMAATRNLRIRGETLHSQLAAFSPLREFSAALLPDGRLRALEPHVAPSLNLTLRDLAANLDFQSLAAVVADLNPPGGADNWDFAFFFEGANSPLDVITIDPGPNDRRFRVFYRLHSLLHPDTPPATPEEAWRTAVDYLTERLEREARFAGGGGFGYLAARELLRELHAVPALAANSLYSANGWFYGDGDFREEAAVWAQRWRNDVALDLVRDGESVGRATASASVTLYPLLFPRDTAVTRLPHLAVGALLAYMAKKAEAGAGDIEAPPETAPPPEPTTTEPPATEIETPVPAPDPGEFDDNEEKRRQDLLAQDAVIAGLQVELNAILRRLDNAREAEKRLTLELLAARARLDRLRERYDEAAREGDADKEVDIPLETARLLILRDEIVARLELLLKSCTEEHPFVRQARRELAAVEALLAKQPLPRIDPVDTTRLRTLYLELEAANANAGVIEERRSRQAAAAADAVAAAEAIERRLAEARRKWNLLAEAKPTPRPAPAATVTLPPAPPAEAAVPPAVSATPFLSVSPPAARIAVHAFPPSRRAQALGLGAGLLAGLLAMLIRELFATRFRTPSEAAPMVGYPLLAALPAYGAKSFRAAAKTMKGELSGTRAGRLSFAPMPVELSEPQPPARRGAVARARRRPRLLVWAIGAALLACALLIQHASRYGIAPPPQSFTGDLEPPTMAALAEEYEEDADWGNMP